MASNSLLSTSHRLEVTCKVGRGRSGELAVEKQALRYLLLVDTFTLPLPSGWLNEGICGWMETGYRQIDGYIYRQTFFARCSNCGTTGD